MKIVREYYAIYHTDESEGYDICIKDSCDRYALLGGGEELDQLIEDLVTISLAKHELDSVFKRFEEL
jgi:hypothetical protein